MLPLTPRRRWAQHPLLRRRLLLRLANRRRLASGGCLGRVLLKACWRGSTQAALRDGPPLQQGACTSLQTHANATLKLQTQPDLPCPALQHAPARAAASRALRRAASRAARSSAAAAASGPSSTAVASSSSAAPPAARMRDSVESAGGGLRSAPLRRCTCLPARMSAGQSSGVEGCEQDSGRRGGGRPSSRGRGLAWAGIQGAERRRGISQLSCQSKAQRPAGQGAECKPGAIQETS